jgi:hypothetical protein
VRVISLVGLLVAAAVALALFSGQLSVLGGGSGASGASSTSIESALACLGTAGVPAQITVGSTGAEQIHVTTPSSAYLSFFPSAQEAGWWATQVAASIRVAQADPAGLVEQRGTVVVAWGAAPSAAERAPVAGCLPA